MYVVITFATPFDGGMKTQVEESRQSRIIVLVTRALSGMPIPSAV